MPVHVLSGGEKNRLMLAKLFLKPANLLVMDEPTNHLDITSKNVLKEALKKFEGTLILVSHDRDFLQGLTNKVYEFKDKKIKEYELKNLPRENAIQQSLCARRSIHSGCIPPQNGSGLDSYPQVKNASENMPQERIRGNTANAVV